MRKTLKLNRLQLIALVPLSLFAVVSLFVGIRHSLQYGSRDLQWIGARMVGQRIDPWQEQLAHLPHHFSHFSPPNYLHALYLILLPLGAMSFHAAAVFWLTSNICFSVLCVLMLRRLFHLDVFQTGVALCLLWMSSPFRVVLEVGQMSIFELFFLTGAYVATSLALGGLSFGVSLVKYSFSPSAALLFLFRGRIRFLLYAAIVPVVGLLGVWLFVRTPLLLLAFEPLKVSSAPTAVSPGFADLMTLADSLLQSTVGLAQARSLSYGLGLLASAAYALLLSRYKLSRSEEFTVISVASLFFVKHLVYDYVFIVVLLCFALTQKSWKIKGPLLGGVLAFWFLIPLSERRWGDDVNVHLGQLAVACGLLAANLGFTTYLIVAAAKQRERLDLDGGDKAASARI
jgi:hypothetical protein